MNVEVEVFSAVVGLLNKKKVGICSCYWSNRNLMGFRPTGCKLLPNHEQVWRSTLTSKIYDALKHVFILFQGA
jgi:hypothetical protein